MLIARTVYSAIHCSSPISTHLLPGYQAVQFLDPCLELCFLHMLWKFPKKNRKFRFRCSVSANHIPSAYTQQGVKTGTSGWSGTGSGKGHHYCVQLLQLSWFWIHGVSVKLFLKLLLVRHDVQNRISCD